MGITPPFKPADIKNNLGLVYIVGAWGLLMALTGAVWILGAEREPGNFAVICILVLTFSKIYVVGHAFMELHEAAAWLQRLFISWCVVLCVTLNILYLAA